MARQVILGSASPKPDRLRNNTYMLLQGRRDNLLIDCAGCPMQALQKVGVDLSTLNHLIVTHRHPDHIYGVPVLVLGLWLCGRTAPLVVMGCIVAMAGCATARSAVQVCSPAAAGST